jgi:hypothetical protein
MDPKGFEELIKNRGLRWKLEKSAYCPNLTDLDAGQHDPNCKLCNNGLLFFGEEVIWGILQNQRLEKFYEIHGVWDIGEAMVTFSAYTEDGKPIDLQHFDRLTCLDYEFRWSELLEHSITGIDRLRYPALSMEFCATARKTYYIDEHFIITPEGHIQWLSSSDQPGYDQINQKGEIVTYVYTARPVFLIVQLIHELRATKAFDSGTNAIMPVRLPQTVLIRRDYLARHPYDDKGMPTTRTPRSGSLVPE